MTTIVDAHAREILDSCRNPAVKVDTVLEGGVRDRATVPSDVSVGAHKAGNGEITGAIRSLDALGQAAIEAAAP